MRPHQRSTAVTLAAAAALALGAATAAHADPTFPTTKFPLSSVGNSSVTGSVIDIHTQGVRIYAQERYTLRGAMPGTTYAVNLTAYGDAVCSPLGLVLAVPGSPTTTANRAGNASARRTFPFPGPPAGLLYLRWTVTDPGGDVVAQTDCVPVRLD